MKKTAKPINADRTIADQFVARDGSIYSLQTRTFPSGVNAKIIHEFYAKGVKSQTKRWQTSMHVNGPIDWVMPQWEQYKADKKGE